MQLAEDQIARLLSRTRTSSSVTRRCSRACACRTSAAARPSRWSSARWRCCARSTRRSSSKLHELIENGRANDALADRMHRLTRRLLRARDAAGASPRSRPRCARTSTHRARCCCSPTRRCPRSPAATARHLRVVPSGSAELKHLRDVLRAGQPRCGQMRDTQRDFLFGPEGSASARRCWCRSASAARSACSRSPAPTPSATSRA